MNKVLRKELKRLKKQGLDTLEIYSRLKELNGGFLKISEFTKEYNKL